MNEVKGFLNQIKIEVKKMFSSKFIIVLVVLLLLTSILVPVLMGDTNNYSSYMYLNYGTQDIVIDGVSIDGNSPLYRYIINYRDNIENLTENAKSDIDDISIEYYETMLSKLLYVGGEIKSGEDFKNDLTWQYRESLSDMFMLDHMDIPKEMLMSIMNFSVEYENNNGVVTILETDYMQELQKDFYNLSDAERIAKYEETEQKIARIENIIINNDFIEYYNYQLEDLNESYQANLRIIEKLEEDIIESPENETIYNEQIKGYIKSNTRILEIQIPIYEYSIEYNVEPVHTNWKYMALNDKKYGLFSILDYTILSEEDYEKESYLKDEYNTYNNYKVEMQIQIDKYTEQLFVAERSIETNKPDMKYVENGSREKVVGFLWISLVVAVIGVIIAGGLVAKEFQSGTIRLLLIRPKTRVKIILSKFFALFTIGFSLYLLSVLLNVIVTGILYGFSDFTYFNYSISSGTTGISFFAYYMPKFLICFVTILFTSTTAFFVSVITRNTALSVAIPLISFIVSIRAMQSLEYSSEANWIVYTPFPYISLALYYISDQTYNQIKPIMGFGIPLMVGLSIIMVIFSTMIFTKKDVTA